MAVIAFPNVPLQSVDISLEWPGQAIFPALYTGERHVYTRGVGLWMGTITWPFQSRADNASEINAIEVFLHQLEGAANVFDVGMPVDQGGRLPDGTDLRVTAVTRTGSTMQVTCNRQSGLFVGDLVTIENRLFQLTTNLSGGMMQLTPYRPIDVTVTDDATPPNTIGAAVNWSAPTLRARRTDAGSVSNRKELEWAGPWTIEIIGV